MYLRLYHGRKCPSEELEDWGIDGPVIGPANIKLTYGKIRVNGDHMVQFDDFVFYDGMYYGDAEVIAADDPVLQKHADLWKFVSAEQFKKQLFIDLERMQEFERTPHLILNMEGGVIQEVLANRRDIKIKMVDFDLFEGDDAVPYEEIEFTSPDRVFSDHELDHSDCREEWDRKYDKWLKEK